MLSASSGENDDGGRRKVDDSTSYVVMFRKHLSTDPAHFSHFSREFKNEFPKEYSRFIRAPQLPE